MDIKWNIPLSLIRQCANFLIVGAVAFSTYAKSYNRLFGYHGNLEVAGSSATEDKCRRKRYKAFTGLNHTCRLESCSRRAGGFAIFAILISGFFIQNGVGGKPYCF